jgi:Astacin (Peptidase family M12A)
MKNFCKLQSCQFVFFAELWSQFDKRSGDTQGLPYDYESILHYGWNYFAIDKKRPTIIPRRGVKKIAIGQRFGMSPMDVKRINLLYKCQEKTSRSSGSGKLSSRTTNRKT